MNILDISNGIAVLQFLKTTYNTVVCSVFQMNQSFVCELKLAHGKAFAKLFTLCITTCALSDFCWECSAIVFFFFFFFFFFVQTAAVGDIRWQTGIVDQFPYLVQTVSAELLYRFSGSMAYPDLHVTCTVVE
jgi:hypothetical protein